MSDLLARAGALFLAPPREPGAPARAAEAAPAPALAVVLAEPSDLAAACGGVAASLRHTAGARTAVVCRATAGGVVAGSRYPGLGDHTLGRTPHMDEGCAPSGAPGGEASDRQYPAAGRHTSGQFATVAASRLARRLLDRGIDAVGRGALCLVELPDAVGAVAPLAWRVIGAAGDAPVVVGVTTRLPELDAFLAQADRLILAARPDADSAYVDLALDSLARLGPPATALAAPQGVIARRAAALGLARVALDAVPVCA